MNDDQTQDSSIVEEVMQEITKYSAEPIIILKHNSSKCFGGAIKYE